MRAGDPRCALCASWIAVLARRSLVRMVAPPPTQLLSRLLHVEASCCIESTTGLALRFRVDSSYVLGGEARATCDRTTCRTPVEDQPMSRSIIYRSGHA